MNKPIIAPAFCQVAWVVRDLTAAETFFTETMGISPFMAMDNIAYVGDTHLEASGHPLIQSLRLPILRVGYFDTREATSVVTEIVGASEAGHELRRPLKAGQF